MLKEFEGRNENEAIDNAVKALGISRDEIDIEVVENKKSLFFLGKNKVIIRVRVEESVETEDNEVISFLSQVMKKMGVKADVRLKENDDNRMLVDIVTADSAILIGKKGKTLDSLQLLANIVAGKNEETYSKVIIDTENYRSRREKNLISFAKRVAEKVKRTRSSMLLEAMNPFERRLIHTTLNKNRDIETVSEGEGLYKKIRVLYKGRR